MNKPIFRINAYSHLFKWVIPIALIIIAGCATDKDAWMNRNYHGMTTRFNGYFNGNESLKEGVALIRQRHKDDYNKILSVFQFGDQTVASSANSYMDVAIKKASVQISKHTMFLRGQEKNRWIDDCWMLIGKAHFYKMEYEMAIQNFDFVIARYKNQPSRYEAMLWKAITNNQLKKFDDNEALLGLLQKSIDDRQVSGKVKRLYPLVKADFFLKQGNTEAAIQPLKDALKLNRSKKTKVRTTYILAQIHQQLDRCEEASKYFKKVVQMNPEYEMAFNAKINMARCFKAAKGEGSRTIRKYLAKMIRDEKNKEYLDQVYFALAEVYLKERNDTLAMKNLKLSVASSTVNQNQKAISSLMLADLYFKYENYPDAQAYYDSAVTYLQKDFPNYDVLMKKHDILSRLVTNILVVQTQDSLQRLAKMPANERMRIVNNIIAEINRKEQEAREQEALQFQNMGFLEMENRNLNQQQQAGNEWYFDNPSSRSFGYTEFRNKWGDRPLEDMWRISSRRGDALMTEEELLLDSIRQDSIKALTANLKNPDHYLKNIPLTPEAMEASNAKIERALYNMGYIYFHDLADLDKSIESFENQIRRFPYGKMIPPAYYQLFQVYTQLGFHDKAAQLKNRLISEHPEHEYALIIADPEYFAKRAKELDRHKSFYANAFGLYQTGRYKEAVLKCDSALALPVYADIHPKLSLLRAMIIGATEGKEAYILALEKTSTAFNKTPEGKHAHSLLTMLREDPAGAKGADGLSGKVIDYSIYKFALNKSHVVLVVIDNKFGKVDRVRNQVSDFNRKSFSSKNLNVTSTVLSDHFQMLTITSFTDARDAMAYYNSFIAENVFAGKDAQGQSAVFAISSDNYPIFFKDKDLEKYEAFFRDHYFK